MRHAHPGADPARRRRRRLVAGLTGAGAVGAITALVAVFVPSASAGTLFEDDFSSGADGWSKSGGSWAVTGGAYQQTKADSELARVFAGDTGWADYTVQAKVKPTALGTGLAGIAARASGSSTMYRLALLGTGRAELQAVKGSTVTALASAAYAGPAAWHTLKIEVSGGTVRGYVDGAAVGAGAGTLPGKGRIALVTSHASASFDDVSVNALGGAPATTAPTSTAPTSTAPTSTAPTAAPAPSATTATAKPSPSAGRTSVTPTATRTTAPATPTATATSPTAWPTPVASVKVSDTTEVTGTFDGGLKRYHGIGSGGQDESQPAMFELADGATLKNVIIGAPAGDGVHCLGSCTIVNVWWEDVGEDAATFKGGASAVYVVDGGGARSADDKVFQHNGGGTLTIRNFQVSDFGKLYRSCGNCKTQHKRAVVIENVTATAPAKSLVGVNANYGDTATLSRVTVVGDRDLEICVRFTGNNTGKEPTKIGSGPDGTTCRYAASDITYK